MKVELAKSAGFCFGVKKAVDTVYNKKKKKEGTVYTYGPIIHNEQVVTDLEEKGVEVIHSYEELERIKSGTIVIRSHGVSKEVNDTITKKGLKLVDATCPFVKKIHNIVAKESGEGRHIIIIGNENHPEVVGIKGWCNGGVTVIHDKEDAEKFSLIDGKTICVVSQTTFNYNKFKYLVEIIVKKGYDINVVNTICNATNVRQSEARKIAKEVDAMLVIGGKHSSNTQKLYEICKEECNNTYYIQTLIDLDISQLQSIGSIGITAGASTPNNIIEEVHTNVREF